MAGGGKGSVCEEVTLRAGGVSTGSTSMSAGGTGGCGEDDNGAFILEGAAASGGVGSREAGTEAAAWMCNRVGVRQRPMPGLVR